jgi:23S rRNA (cytidine1920-2'-O)/16S rRNA (cytidine1409-2'-O)-methyltransferase
MTAPGHRSRLDGELVRRGLAPSREVAQKAIAAGQVTVDGAPGRKPSTLVTRGQQLVVRGSGRRFVSRGGDKLDGALDALGLDVSNRIGLDAGASTGGFTDVLLQRGARTVVAVDVGYGQLAWKLRSDDRVVVLERTHARDLTPDDLHPHVPDLVVADLSFISLASVLPALRRVAAPDADWCCLVKPQFEAGPSFVERGGVVRDPAGWRVALEQVAQAADDLGLGIRAGTVSPLPGPAGNIEFFLWLCAEPSTARTDVIERLVVDGSTLRAAHAG